MAGFFGPSHSAVVEYQSSIESHDERVFDSFCPLGHFLVSHSFSVYIYESVIDSLLYYKNVRTVFKVYRRHLTRFGCMVSDDVSVITVL